MKTTMNNLIQRGRIYNKYTYVNPLHALKSSLDFLTDGRDPSQYASFSLIVECISRLHGCDEESFNTIIYYIRRQHGNMLRLIKSGGGPSCTMAAMDIWRIIEGFVESESIRISFILIRREEDDGDYDERVMYWSLNHHVCCFHKDVQEECANLIKTMWRSHKTKQEMAYKKAHQSLFWPTLETIKYMPHGGPNGNFAWSIVGKGFVDCLKRFQDNVHHQTNKKRKV